MTSDTQALAAAVPFEWNGTQYRIRPMENADAVAFATWVYGEAVRGARLLREIGYADEYDAQMVRIGRDFGAQIYRPGSAVVVKASSSLDGLKRIMHICAEPPFPVEEIDQAFEKYRQEILLALQAANADPKAKRPTGNRKSRRAAKKGTKGRRSPTSAASSPAAPTT